MQTLRVTVRCEGAAFEDDPSFELADILEKIANNLRANGTAGVRLYQTILDYNGNDVGRWKVS